MGKRLITILLVLLTVGTQAFAQSSVSGKVTDKTGEPLVGVNVLIKGTTTGTMTELDGTYTLPSVKSGAVLIFSSVGFASQEIQVGSRKVINVVLTEDTEFLEEVVYVAYGTAKKKDLTGSITQVDGNSIAVQAQGSITRTLEGQVAGLQTTALDGQPGLDMGIRIRGIGSKSANNANALIIIDGTPATDGINPLSSLNSNDIASVTVLKDAASTAMYGSRGANGVILITTKSGNKGKTKVTFSGRWGINALGGNATIDRIGMGNPGDYYEYVWQSIYNELSTGPMKGNDSQAREFASAHLFDYTGSTTNFGRNALGNWMAYKVPGMNITPTGSGQNASGTMSGEYLVGTDGKLNSNAELLYDGGTAYDELYSTRFRQEYNVTASGGTDKVDYHISLGALSDPSYVKQSSFKRYTARANVNAEITDFLKVGTKFGYTNRHTRSQATRYGRNPGAATQNIFYWINETLPLKQVYARTEAGSFMKDANGNRLVAMTSPNKANTANSYSPFGATTGLSTTNLPGFAEQSYDDQGYDDLNLHGYARVKFLKHFTFETNLSYNTTFGVRERFFNAESAAFVSGLGGSAISRVKNVFKTMTTQQLFNYNQDFGKHHVDAIAGHEYYQYDQDETRYASAHSLIDDFTGYANFLGTQTYGSFGSANGGSLNKLRMESYFLRANYIFDDKYYVSASIRRDGSSKFKHAEDRWGTFWSVGGGWRISSEPFMEFSKTWLDNLKLRASYGVIGNQNGIGYYSGYTTWGYGGSNWRIDGSTIYPGSTSLSRGSWQNPYLTWENVHTTDAGLDFTLFGGKVSGSFDWYNRQTVNALWDKNVSYLATGQATLTLNTAGIRNRGFELELSYQPVKTKDWDVILSTNGTHYNTVLTSLPKGATDPFTASADSWSLSGGGSSNGSEYYRGVGKDYYNMYLYRYGGVAGNSGKVYYDDNYNRFSGYDASSNYNGYPLFYHKVTAAEAEAGTFGTGVKEGDDILTTKTALANKYEMGDAIPEWIGGFTANVRYKNFDLTAMFSYQIGGKFYSVEYGNGQYRGSGNIGGSISSELFNNTWSESNKDAYFPMQVYSQSYRDGATIGSWAYTDMALFSASYLSIKNITLGYTLPAKITNKAKISSLRVFASADNPVLLYSHSGVDPRWSLVGGMEVGAAAYPYLAVYSFGVDISF